MLENKYSVDPTTAAAAALVAGLRAQADAYEARVVAAQMEGAELAARAAQLREDVGAAREAMGGVTRAEEVSVRAQRLVVLLENRVERAAGKRGEAELRGAALRARVDGLRRERRLFDQLAAKMRRGTGARAREAAAVLARAAAAHEAMDKAEAMRAAVKTQAARDVAAAEGEWARLTDVIEADRRQREAARAAGLKDRDDRMAALFRREFAQARRVPEEGAGAGAGAGVARPEAPSPTPPAEKLRLLHEAAAAVAAAAGAASAEEVVAGVAAAQATCFRLFGAVTSAHGRVEELEDRADALRREAAALRGQPAGGGGAGAPQAEAPGKSNGAAETVEAEAAAAAERVRAVCARVQELFVGLGCAAMRLSWAPCAPCAPPLSRHARSEPESCCT
jgi:hypothetical protein